MPICIVPNCATNKYKSAEKCSTFQVPTNENFRAKWIASIPGVESLRSTQRVCEKHFEEHFIVKEFIKYDNTGKIIAQVPFKRARLQKEAVPTIFEQSQSRSRSPRKVVEVRVKNYTDHSYALQEPSTFSHSRATVGCELVNTSTTLNCDTNVATQSLDEFGDNEQVLPNNNKCLSAHVSVEADTDVHCHLVDSSTMENELPYEESNVTKYNIEAPMHTNSACLFTTVTFDSVKFNFNAPPGDDTFANDCPLKLPKPWNVCKSTTEKEETLLFTYVVTANDRGTEKHIFEKTLIITSSREIKYEIYMTPSDITGTKLPRVLDNISMLPDILKKFKDMRVCKGTTSIGLEFVPGNTSLKVCAGADWRHADCKMLSVNSERCSFCKKYSNALSQKVRRMKKRTNIKRVSASNYFEEIKLNAMRKKIKYLQLKAHRFGKKTRFIYKLYRESAGKSCKHD